MATSSGMAALNTILFALLEGGDHVVGTSSVYGPSRMVISRDWARFGIESTFVDTSDLDAVKAAIRPETKIVFIETPANPTIVLTDIGAVAAVAHEHGALLIVDNTFASPILQRPIEHGADIVFHSMTKFINGHTDIVAGMVVPKTVQLFEKIKPVFNYLGACMDPHQAWLALRGFKTLALRVKACQENALKVAAYLENHSSIEWVRYPGLQSHPQYELAQRQMDSVRLMTLAVSLGGIETLIQHPSSMTHASMPRQARLAAGITDGLVRVSVGCEDAQDIIGDFDQVLNPV